MKKIFVALLCVLSLCGLTSLAMAENKNVLHVFNWSEYIPQDVLDQFTKETGIEVVYTTYESNEAMYAKLKLLDGKGYDIVVPSTYLVDLLREANLLSPIDKSQLPNIKYLDQKLISKAFSTEDTYSIPYMWGMQGFMVNKNAVDPKTITSWNDLFRPEFKEKLLLGDDMRDTMGAALFATGAPLNTKDPAHIKAAFEWLQKLKPHVRIFDVTAAKQALISEEVTAGFIWNGDAFIALQENPNLEFIYPKEGAPLWLDSFAIPTQAANKEGAHTFINFMLRPEIAARCVEEYNYSSPNTGVREHLPEEIAQSPLIFPTEEMLGNSQFSKGLGESQKIYEEFWVDLKIGE